jgi:hypothetical protein
LGFGKSSVDFFGGIMKKLVLIGLLGLVAATAGVFADHPSGWGLGGGAEYGAGWDTPTDGRVKGVLHIKAPALPVYWSVHLDVINTGTKDSAFELNFTGDYYIIDKTLSADIGLGWFLGLGGYLSFYHQGPNTSYKSLGAGARLPIGLSWQPLDFLEIFMDIAPSLGARYCFGADAPEEFDFPTGGWQGDFAVRFWF